MQTGDTYDQALLLIHARGDEDERGFTNHAPMVIDALVGLERPDHIPVFLDGYLDRFPPASAGRPFAADTVPGRRRGIDTAADWSATWQDRIETAGDWRPVLGSALAQLSPAFFSGAAHGLLRVAHAVRALERRDTPVRRSELARGLGYWCASHQTLPGRPGSAASADLDVAALMDRLEVIPPEDRKWGLFTDGARALEDHAPFAEALSRLSVPDEVDADVLSDATSSMLGPYFESPLLRIAYVHTITAPSALRFVVHHADAPTRRALFAHGVQAMAALHAISKLPSEAPRRGEPSRQADEIESLRTRAADTLEEHVIKFTEACLRENALRPDARWRLAADDAISAHESARG